MDVYPVRTTVRRSVRRLLKSALAATAALALSFAGIAILPSQAAVAGPATVTATPVVQTTRGALGGTVPGGVCTVTAEVLGGAGGSAVTTTTNSNGAGAKVTATIPVLPGMSYSGTVGGGGGKPTGSGTTDTAGPAGVNGGGMGGTSGEASGVKHHGAGGGGFTDLSFDGTLAVLAGGGGGAGGGHSTTTNGAGGDAGLPAGTGVADGEAGNIGKDYPNSAVVNGGAGGTSTPGAGGTNSQSSAQNGFVGVLRVGGKGGNDTNPDAGGGGGGGYAGGGGGASTVTYNTEHAGAAGSEIAGAGGGGGSSYVATSTTAGNITGISSALGAKITTATAGAGANGSLKLTWNACSYDLAVTKAVSPTSLATGATATWTVTVTNNGPDAMTQGDTVTLADTLPGAGAKTITGIAVSGGTNAVLQNGAFTCGATVVGSAMPSSLDCSRPYQPVGGSVSGVRGLNVGETLTITYTQPITEAAGASLTNTATVTDRPTTSGNNSATATVSVLTPPAAVNDTSTGNTLNTPVTLNVTTNDSGTFGPSPVTLWNPAAGGSAIASPYVVAGQGTWTVSGDNVTFTPLASFKGDPTPVTYRITATNGLTATALVTITYVPAATNDSQSNLVIGAPATVHVLTNDDGDWDTSTLRIMNGSTPVTSLTVAGQGVWTVSGSDVVFTPQSGFVTDPTPITYRITDTTGDNVTATVTLNYVPGAANDSSLGNTIGATVDQNVLTNDTGSFTSSTLVFASNGGTTLVVAGQGTWTVQSGGVIRFVPEAGYKGDPTPVTYRVTDTTGDQVTATVTVGYVPSATNDSKGNQVLGTAVNVTVLTNDIGDWAATSVRIMNGSTPVTSLVVPGEGTWTANADNTVTFSPLPTFYGDPAPITYQVTDTTGDKVTATVTVSYLPLAVDDSQTGLTIGSVATVPVLTNDQGIWTTSTLRLVNPVGGASVTSVTVAGQGTWTISGSNVVFTPLATFKSDPTPLYYRITDTSADTVSAKVTLNYQPTAVNDSNLGNTIGATVNTNVLTNDPGTWNTGSLVFSGNGTGTLVVAGQGTWTVQSAGVIRFVPEAGYKGDPTPVAYSVTDIDGDTVSAQLTVAYVPSAANDSSLNNPLGTAVTVHVQTNDIGDWAANSPRLLNGSTPVTILTVPGQGVWTVSGADIVFTPQSGYLGDPTPVTYRATDTTADQVTATVTVTYVPDATNDHLGPLAIGSPATVHVLTNDHGDFVASSLRILDGTTPVTSLTLAGQGVWTVSGSDIVFTPTSTFTLDPTPIDYRVTDSTGDSVEATVTVDYVPSATNDQSLGHALGDVVTINVLTNDNGGFDTSSVRFAANNANTLVVAGQGTWSNVSGSITFTPLPTFLGDPAPVAYTVQDTDGDSTGALITVTYVPNAADDSDLGNAFGSTVNVGVLGNDHGDWVAGGIRILNGATPVTTLHVANQGTWVAEADNSVSFVPDAGFLTDPTPVRYQLTDTTGDKVDAQVTITYLPQAVDDAQGGLAIGSVATVAVLGNDNGDWVNSSLRLIDPISHGAVTSVTVAGEGTWTISGTSVKFTPLPAFLVDPTPIGYRITDSTGDDATAQIVLDYGPGAADDEDLDNVLHSTVDVSVFANDSGSFDAATLSLSGTAIVTSLAVPGEGTWTVRSGGIIRFVPLATFLVDPTVQHYQVTDSTGDVVTAKLTITYLPLAVNDSRGNLTIGAAVTVPVLTNDHGDFDASSVRLINPVTHVVATGSVTVPGQGTWSLGAAGAIVFTPQSGFLVDPAPIDYRVTDVTGDTTSATITLDYVPVAVDDASLGNALGTVIDLSVFGNDHGSFDASTLSLSSSSILTTLAVPAEGTWTVRPGGVVRFTPLASFQGDPTPVRYYADDVTGDPATAFLTITYIPAAADDSDLGNVLGTDVNVAVLANDSGDFGSGNLRVLNGATPVLSMHVAGQGTWNVESDDTITFVPDSGFLTDPTPVHYRVTDTTGDAVSALITVTYLPVAADDSKLGNVLGSTVNVPVLANDTGSFVAASVRILNAGTPVTSLVVAGQGEWRANSDGSVSFIPQSGFLVDPAPVGYQVTDTTGDIVSAQVTITYLPTVAADVKNGNVIGSPAVLNVLTNDTGDFDPATLRILDPTSGLPVTTVVVAAQGTWTTDTAGHITFTPNAGYLGNPTPLTYQITDVTGDTVTALATVTYLPTAADDKSLGNPQGKVVTVPILTNDQGLFDISSARLMSKGVTMMNLVAPGQGRWHMDAAIGQVTFTPDAGFTGDPTPVPYRVLDVNGNVVTANVTITYLHPTAVSLALTGMSSETPLMIALAAIILGLGALVISRSRRITARHRM